MGQPVFDSVMMLGAAPAADLAADLLVILVAAAIVTMAMRRLRLATIPGYLIAGALVGPAAFGLVTDTESIETISQLAIVLLMFGVGMSIDLTDIRGGLAILSVGLVSSVVFILVGWPLAVLFGLGWAGALVAAMALVHSSTAVSLRILQAHRELDRMHGRLCVGGSLVQDLLSVPMLVLLPAVAAWTAMGEPEPGAEALSWWARVGEWLGQGAVAVGGVALLLVLGRLFLPRLMQEAAHGSVEILIVLAAAAALFAAYVTNWLGFSPALGAFLAGLLLASTPFRFQIAGQLAPMRDLFMAVFFTSIGLYMDFLTIVGAWWIVLLGVAVLLVVKSGVITLTAWALGATGPVAVMTGLVLAQAGEFTLVILAAAGALGLVDDRVVALLIAVVVLSLILTPLLHGLGHRLDARASRAPLAPWVRASALREGESVVQGPGAGADEDTDPLSTGHIIIAGYGVVGRAVAEHFHRRGLRYTVIELNPATVRTQTRLGRSIVYGDVTNPEVLESAGVHRASAVVLTIPDDNATLRACRLIRSMAPGIFIAARTSYLSKAMLASQMGADHVVVEEMAAAEAMGREVIDKLTRRREDRAGDKGGGDGAAGPPAGGGVSGRGAS